MPARLSRKRYTEITRYLKAVIADDSKSDRMRMAAVESLLEVYARHDRSELQREQRRRAAEAPQDASQPAGSPEAQEAHQGPLNAVDVLDAFLEKIRADRKDVQ
jgi:hypothetical protein